MSSRLMGAVACFVVLALSACAESVVSGQERAVEVATTACGDASQTSGAGLIAEDGWVIASGHVVSGAGSVEVSTFAGSQVAEIVVFDAEADLALLRVESATGPKIELTPASVGSAVEFGGGGPSGVLQASVLRPVDVRIEGVRTSERVSRVGYEIDVRVALGDSGGGVYDDQDRLVGVIYGRSADDVERSFIVGHEAIRNLLEADRSSTWSCDPDQSRIVTE